MTTPDVYEVTESRPSTQERPGDLAAPPSVTPASSRGVMWRRPPRALPPPTWPGPIAGMVAGLLLAAAAMLCYVLVVFFRALLADGGFP